MWNNLTQLTSSPIAVIDLSLAKSHLYVDSSDYDDYITMLCVNAQAFVEGKNGIGVPLLTQQWQVNFPSFYSPNGLVLPLNPVQSVDQIQYISAANVLTTLPTTIYDYDVSRDPCAIFRAYNQSFPTVLPVQKAVQVQFTCGFGDDPTDCPGDIRQAILCLIEHWWTNRTTVAGLDSRVNPVEVPFTTQMILDKYRAIAVA